ncbi:hypothetical protein PQO01_04865 [Lentisphaera marina]|uniref:hypothetical protein n=1 Tax=Lentisphaera marina TaxID=1111041 RepID=UPI002365E0E6|nr:hypothetical protein [Lentisphaera marina]MDD7984277.1 hypothetical protein [Lentisphaera marina]
MKQLLALLFICIFASCASTAKTESDTKKETSEVKTQKNAPEKSTKPSNGGLDL